MCKQRFTQLRRSCRCDSKQEETVDEAENFLGRLRYSSQQAHSESLARYHIPGACPQNRGFFLFWVRLFRSTGFTVASS